MQPLRDGVEFIPYGFFGRTEEKKLAPSDHEIPSREAVDAYLLFLDSLEPLERRVLAEDTAPTETGRIAEKVGIDDVTVKEIGICGSGAYPWKNSATVEAMLEDMGQSDGTI